MSQPHTIEFVHQVAKKRNGICLSTVYKSQKEKLKFQCSEEHIFEMAFDNVLHGKQWCPKCVKYLSEELCRYIFENLLKIKLTKTTFKHKGHCLELDGYNEENNIAFEYNGRQHYEITPFYKTEKELKYRKYLDRLKREYCKINKIQLVTIPYTVKNNDLLKHISGILKITNIVIDLDNFINNYSYYKKRKEFIIDIISNKGGTLVKFNPDDIEVQCKNNHIWTTQYYSIKKGHWCSKCYNLENKRYNTNIPRKVLFEKTKLTKAEQIVKERGENYIPFILCVQRKFDEVVTFLRQHNIICLSPISEYINAGQSILKFKCENGHIFEDTFDYLLDRIKGRQDSNNRKICQECLTIRQNRALKQIKEKGLVLINHSAYKNKKEELE